MMVWNKTGKFKNPQIRKSPRALPCLHKRKMKGICNYMIWLSEENGWTPIFLRCVHLVHPVLDCRALDCLIGFNGLPQKKGLYRVENS